MTVSVDANLLEETVVAIDRLPDDQLLESLESLVAHERHATVRLIAGLAEVERRRLYLGQGCSSLFTYCTEILGLSEDAAYNRIHAARAGLRFPILLRDLESGALTVSTVRLLAPMLTPENHAELLSAARHRTKREVERLVASVAPIRSLTAGPSVTPIGNGAYLLQFTVAEATYDKVREAQALLRHDCPEGALAALFDRAVDALLRDLKRTKMGVVGRPRRRHVRADARSRTIPVNVRREVWARDEGRCAFVGREGRCTERAFLEMHHLVPFADGGDATAENIQLRCRAHNAYEAERWDPESVAQKD